MPRGGMPSPSPRPHPSHLTPWRCPELISLISGLSFSFLAKTSRCMDIYFFFLPHKKAHSSAPCSFKPSVYPGNLPSVYRHSFYSFLQPHGTAQGRFTMAHWTTAHGVEIISDPAMTNYAIMNNLVHTCFNIINGILQDRFLEVRLLNIYLFC